METTVFETHASTASTIERATFGLRFGAYIIDFVILVALAVVLAPLLGGILGSIAGASIGENAESAGMGGFLGMIIGSFVMIPVIYFIYYLIEGISGFTLGKLMLGVRVGAADGRKSGIGNLLIRYLIKSSGTILSIIALVLSISILGNIGTLISLALFVGCFFVLGEKRQAFHDMLSGTAVYRKNELS